MTQNKRENSVLQVLLSTRYIENFLICVFWVLGPKCMRPLLKAMGWVGQLQSGGEMRRSYLHLDRAVWGRGFGSLARSGQQQGIGEQAGEGARAVSCQGH